MYALLIKKNLILVSFPFFIYFFINLLCLKLSSLNIKGKGPFKVNISLESLIVRRNLSIKLYDQSW